MTSLPKGLKTSPSCFLRAMTVASGLNYEICRVYTDDLALYGRNFEIHKIKLMDFFIRLRKYNLKLNLYKCNSVRKEVLYLGHLVSADGITSDPDKIKALQNYPD